MVSAPALILGLLVIVIGFLIIPDIIDGQENIINESDNLECTFNEGSCVPEDECQEANRLEHACAEGSVCCSS